MSGNDFTQLEETSIEAIGRLIVENNTLRKKLEWYESQELIKKPLIVNAFKLTELCFAGTGNEEVDKHVKKYIRDLTEIIEGLPNVDPLEE